MNRITPHVMPVTGAYEIDRLAEAVYAGLAPDDRICALRELPAIPFPALTIAKVVRSEEAIVDRFGTPYRIVQSVTWRPDARTRPRPIDPGSLWAPIVAAIARYQRLIAGGGFVEPVLDVGIDTVGKCYLGDAVTAAVRSGLAEFDEHRFLRIREDVVSERRAKARHTVWSDQH